MTSFIVVPAWSESGSGRQPTRIFCASAIPKAAVVARTIVNSFIVDLFFSGYLTQPLLSLKMATWKKRRPNFLLAIRAEHCLVDQLFTSGKMAG